MSIALNMQDENFLPLKAFTLEMIEDFYQFTGYSFPESQNFPMLYLHNSQRFQVIIKYKM